MGAAVGGPGSEGYKGKVLRMDRPRGRRVLKFDGAFGPRVVGRLRRRFYKPPSADPFRLSAPLPTP